MRPSSEYLPAFCVSIRAEHSGLFPVLKAEKGIKRVEGGKQNADVLAFAKDLIRCLPGMRMSEDS